MRESSNARRLRSAGSACAGADLTRSKERPPANPPPTAIPRSPAPLAQDAPSALTYHEHPLPSSTPTHSPLATDHGPLVTSFGGFSSLSPPTPAAGARPHLRPKAPRARIMRQQPGGRKSAEAITTSTRGRSVSTPGFQLPASSTTGTFEPPPAAFRPASCPAVDWCRRCASRTGRNSRLQWRRLMVFDVRNWQ